MEFSSKTLDNLNKISQKYDAIGQNMESYLEGLLYANSLSYWDYIHLDTLLSIQNPRTNFDDEKIFIIYHQITELYFKLILNELKLITDNTPLPPSVSLHERLNRINNYFHQLSSSFNIMVEGLNKEEFLKFRMALLPASGFQSVQFRMIEIYCASLYNLCHNQQKTDLDKKNLSECFKHLYWRYGNMDLTSGKKTLTLIQFEEKYDKTLKDLALSLESRNLSAQFELSFINQSLDDKLIALLKELDLNANVAWPLRHYRSAAKHLNKQPHAIKATGGTNWQKFLPPTHQRIIFFPFLWDEEDIDNWGRPSLLKKYHLEDA